MPESATTATLPAAALLHEAIDPRLGNNNDIGGFAVLDTLYDHRQGGERDREPVSGCTLEFRAKIFHDRLHC
jgi:hypothetical protein